MKKAIKTVCVAGGALFGLYTIFYAGMAVGIGYGLTSDKDGSTIPVLSLPPTSPATRSVTALALTSAVSTW